MQGWGGRSSVGVALSSGTEQEREMRNDGVHLSDAGMSQVGDWLVDKVFFETSGS